MSNVVDSLSNLCHSYIDLADRFQQLDVEHMTLKGKVVPLLKALKAYQKSIASLKEEKLSLEQALMESQAECKTLTAKYDAVKELEPLLGDAMKALVHDAEEQSVLVKETIEEIEVNGDPDLSEEEKGLLALFYSDPEEFSAVYSQTAESKAFNPQAAFVPETADPALV